MSTNKKACESLDQLQLFELRYTLRYGAHKTEKGLKVFRVSSFPQVILK